MAKIGNIKIELSNEYLTGIAIEIISPPNRKLSVRGKGYLIKVAPKTNYLVCHYKKRYNPSELYSEGLELIHIGIDFLAAKFGYIIETKDKNHDILYWSNHKEKRFNYICNLEQYIIVASEERINEKKNNIELDITKDDYYIAYRYYRLSKITNDIFESYRNLYLCFENIISTIYPKFKTQQKLGLIKFKEDKWISYILNELYDELNLEDLESKPSTKSLNIKYIVKTIYKTTRNDLFHSKHFKKPNINETKLAYNMLLIIVNRLLHKITNINRPKPLCSSWLNPKIYNNSDIERLNECVFELCENDFIDDKKFEATNQKRYPSNIEIPDSSSLGITIKGTLKNTCHETSFQTVYLHNEKQCQFAAIGPKNKIDLNGFDYLETTLNVTARVNPKNSQFL